MFDLCVVTARRFRFCFQKGGGLSLAAAVGLSFGGCMLPPDLGMLKTDWSAFLAPDGADFEGGGAAPSLPSTPVPRGASIPPGKKVRRSVLSHQQEPPLVRNKTALQDFGTENDPSEKEMTRGSSASYFPDLPPLPDLESLPPLEPFPAWDIAPSLAPINVTAKKSLAANRKVSCSKRNRTA